MSGLFAGGVAGGAGDMTGRENANHDDGEERWSNSDA